MATKVIKTIFKFKRGTHEHWVENGDMIPFEGEPCFDIDENVLRIGNGINKYSELTPIGGVGIDVDGKTLILADKTLKLFGFDAAEVGAQPRKNADGQLEWIVPSAESLEGLQTIIASMQSDLQSLQTNVTTLQKLTANFEAGAQVNKLEQIKINDTVLGIIDKTATIPIASNNTLGVVRGSDEIAINGDGSLSIQGISFDKIIQADQSQIIIDGGNATI